MMTAPAGFEVVSQYMTAAAARDSEKMNSLRSEEFALDFVHADAYENSPLSAKEAQMFWPAWFTAFPEFHLEVTRTIAAEEVVVTQWIFTATNTGPLDPPIFEKRMEPTGKTIRIRGVSVYDITEGLIQRESLYIDLATLIVELGVEL